MDGITYAGNHGLEIMHPDGHVYSHSIPQDYRDRLVHLIRDLREEAARVVGAWVEDKGLLVALHYRYLSVITGHAHLQQLVFMFIFVDTILRLVDKLYVNTLLERAKAIYTRYDFEYLTVSKRLENSPPEGFNRGDTCIHILRSLFGVDWEVSD